MGSVAVVLGAGGLTGRAFHAGVLSALQDAGFDARDADLLVGTSAGAGIASTTRAGFSAADQVNNVLSRSLSADLAARLAHLPPPVVLPKVMTRPEGPPVPSSLRLAAQSVLRKESPRMGLLVAGFLPNGDHSTERIGSRIRGLFDTPWPTDPIWICALRHDDGARVVFGRDVLQTDIGTAVEASSAVPGFFEPTIIDGDRYIDGGTHSPSNLDVVAGLGFDLVVISSPMSGTHEALSPVRRHMARWYHHRLLLKEAALVRASGTPVLIFEPDHHTIHLMGDHPLDPGRNEEIVDHVREIGASLLTGTDEAARVARSLFPAATPTT